MSNCFNNTIIICDTIIDYCIKYCNDNKNICYCDCIISRYYTPYYSLCVYNMSSYIIFIIIVSISIFLYILYSLHYNTICKKKISNTNIVDNISYDNISYDNMSYDNMSLPKYNEIEYTIEPTIEPTIQPTIEHTIQPTILPINDNILPPPPPYV